jgi:predicted glycoside hydrolase/deacetylase ChbG (UPF0249 family)
MTGALILNADDYGISAGVSRAIATLAEAGRISSTSAIVTRPRWRDDAAALRDLRDRIAIGLHVNLTLGSPLGAMPRVAPSGQFPGLLQLTARAAMREAKAEIAYEIQRQLYAFEEAIGSPPDMIDGHQHVHALPGVRAALFEALAERHTLLLTLLRDPGDLVRRIAKRPRAKFRATAIAAMTKGFGASARRLGLSTNCGFSGFTNFVADRDAVRADFCSAAQCAGPMHIVMAHPGRSDAELAALDPHLLRRDLEFDFLMRDDAFNARVWRPRRQGSFIEWPDHLSAETAS